MSDHEEQSPPPGRQGAPGWRPPYAPEHPQATTALVLGVLGLAACGVLAPFALVIGRRAMREIDASGGRLGGRGTAQAVYVMGVVGSVLLAVAVAGLVAALLLFGALGLGSMVYVG
ncbi:MAG: DUF4190 domain-containing protein [Nocardioidaceae bacterium]